MKKVLAFFAWQRVPAKEIRFKKLKQETQFLLSYSIFYILLAFLIAWAILWYPMPILMSVDFIQDFWYAIVFKLVFLLILPAWVYFHIWKYSFQDLLLGINWTGARVIKGILLIAFGFFLNAGHIAPISEKMGEFSDAPIRLLLGIILPFFIAGLPEELFFRGYLQTRLEKITNPMFAILVSGVLFTAWHLPTRFFLAHGVEGQAGDFSSILVGTGGPVMIISIFFGWHWARFRNLPLLILVHWAIDILPSLSSFFQIHR